MKSSSSKLVSSHGLKLLKELQDPSSTRVDFVLECLDKDPLAGRLKLLDTGENAYHLLLRGEYPEDVTLTILNRLVQTCPDGVKAVDRNEELPLHICLCQNQVHVSVLLILLGAYPDGAKKKNGLGLIPLFLCVMRSDATEETCKQLCKAYPDGPSQTNATMSYPLHFACRRTRPNTAILRILLRRFPAAAASVNQFGVLPLHCLCTVSDNVEAVRMVYEAYPEAASIKDRQGRTCLHLAVLLVGKEHSASLQEEELQLIRDRERSLRPPTPAISPSSSSSSSAEMSGSNRGAAKSRGGSGGGSGGKAGGGRSGSANAAAAAYSAADCAAAAAAAAGGDDGSDEDGDGDSGDDGAGSGGARGGKRRSGEGDLMERGRSRAVVRLLIQAYPLALVTPNNFHATPVETVLEKTKKVETKTKRVQVWGLYDDPPTARLLLLAHRHFRSRPIPIGPSGPAARVAETGAAAAAAAETTGTGRGVTSMLPEPPSAAQSPTSAISPPTSSPASPASPHTSPHTSPVTSPATSPASPATSPHTSPSTSIAMSPIGRVLPPMRSAHFHHLKELNWQARRMALLMSFAGYPSPLAQAPEAQTLGAGAGAGAGSGAAKATNGAAIKTKPGAKKGAATAAAAAGGAGGSGVASKKEKGGKSATAAAAPGDSSGAVSSAAVVVVAMPLGAVARNNLLGRLRRAGFDELVRLCISWL